MEELIEKLDLLIREYDLLKTDIRYQILNAERLGFNIELKVFEDKKNLIYQMVCDLKDLKRFLEE